MAFKQLATLIKDKGLLDCYKLDALRF